MISWRQKVVEEAPICAAVHFGPGAGGGLLLLSGHHLFILASCFWEPPPLPVHCSTSLFKSHQYKGNLFCVCDFPLNFPLLFSILFCCVGPLSLVCLSPLRVWGAMLEQPSSSLLLAVAASTIFRIGRSSSSPVQISSFQCQSSSDPQKFPHVLQLQSFLDFTMLVQKFLVCDCIAPSQWKKQWRLADGVGHCHCLERQPSKRVQPSVPGNSDSVKSPFDNGQCTCVMFCSCHSDLGNHEFVHSSSIHLFLCI